MKHLDQLLMSLSLNWAFLWEKYIFFAAFSSNIMWFFTGSVRGNHEETQQ